MHCNSVFWSFPKGRLWVTSNFIETFFFFPVPVFFMITGATLVNYRDRYTTLVFLKKRFQRTLIPFLFWSLMALVYRILADGYRIASLRDVFNDIVTTNLFSVYWFFIPLFAIYLSLPLISAVSKELRINVFGYIAIITFALNSVLPTLLGLAKISFNTAIQPPVSQGYILYILIGYIISNIELSKRQRLIIYAGGVLGWLVHFGGTSILSQNAGEIVGTFKGYLNFPAVMHSIGVFVLFKHFPWEKVICNSDRTIVKLSTYTFGIYLMHFFFVLSIPRLMGIDVANVGWRLLGPFVIFVLCAVLSKVFSKIPIFHYLIGV